MQRQLLLTVIAVQLLSRTIFAQEPQVGVAAVPVGAPYQVEQRMAEQRLLLPPERPRPLPPIQPESPAPTSGAPLLTLGDSEVVPAKPPKLWEGGLELGLNGSEGNSQNFDLHLGARLKRKTEINILSSELDYRKNSSDSVDTVNKAFLDSRFEHLIEKSRWTWFVHNVEDYDEFKTYDLRVSLDAGIGYQWIKNDATTFVSRVGGGATQEIGGPDDTGIPEAVFGLEGEHKLGKRHKLSASVEYRPDVTDFADYRLYMKAAWEVLLDEENHLSMKVGVLDRYDSYGDGRQPNDFDYALTLLWSF